MNISLRLRQNGCHFADHTFKSMLLNKNVITMIKISVKLVPKGLINNTPASVQIMAWCRPVDKPLPERMMVRLPMHICITRSQWDIQKIHITIVLLPYTSQVIYVVEWSYKRLHKIICFSKLKMDASRNCMMSCEFIHCWKTEIAMFYCLSPNITAL